MIINIFCTENGVYSSGFGSESNPRIVKVCVSKLVFETLCSVDLRGASSLVLLMVLIFCTEYRVYSSGFGSKGNSCIIRVCVRKLILETLCGVALCGASSLVLLLIPVAAEEEEEEGALREAVMFWNPANDAPSVVAPPAAAKVEASARVSADRMPKDDCSKAATADCSWLSKL